MDTATNATFTPGPWKAEDIGAGTCAWGVVAEGGRVVVEHDFVSGPDARLIAAAPELLAACRKALASLHGDDDRPSLLDVEHAVVTAIAKAEAK